MKKPISTESVKRKRRYRVAGGNMKIAMITGASSGMGKAFVKVLLQSGMDVDEIWLVARREKRMQAFTRLYPDRQFRILSLDLASKEKLSDLKEMICEEKPQIELLVHSAGFGVMGDVAQLSDQVLADMVDLNCRSVVEIASMCLPFMGPSGRMIFMASGAAFLPQPGFAVYAASKAFVLSFVRALRAEKAARGLRITAVCPGAVKTEFFNRALEKKDMPPIKKMVMADPKKVVNKAWKDNAAGREVSVYSRPMKVFHLITKIVPHRILLKIAARMT